MRRYQVISPIKHDGKRITEGEVKLPAHVGERLVASGAVVAIETPPADAPAAASKKGKR